MREDDELDDAFIAAVAMEASRALPEAMVKSYLDLLVGKGYLLMESDRVKTTDKFGDLVMEAAEELGKRDPPIRRHGNLLAALAWRMTRIALEQDGDGLNGEMNPAEVGRLMNVIHKLLQGFFKDQALLREALDNSVYHRR